MNSIYLVHVVDAGEEKGEATGQTQKCLSVFLAPLFFIVFHKDRRVERRKVPFGCSRVHIKQ